MNHKTKDILERIEESSPNESSHELICRLRDCAHEIGTLRAALASRPDAQADERGALMCERLRAMGLNPANEAADLIEQMGRAAAPQAEAAQGVPEGWKLVPIKPTAEMLDAGARHIPALHVWTGMIAAAPAPVSEPSPDREQVGETRARDAEISQLVDERDTFEHMGTALAQKVGELLNTDVGEWSSANNPIFRAIHVIEDRISADASPSRERGEPPAVNAGIRNKIAAALHYPDHWDTAAYPTLDDAAWEAIASAKLTCSECGERQDADFAESVLEIAECFGQYDHKTEVMEFNVERLAPFVKECIDRLAASAPTQQDCPHGVDDGACGWCYDEATSVGQEEQPSFTNPLTPYGMLVRALRIVVGTTLYDMAQWLNISSSDLSSVEFGRQPVSGELLVGTAKYFAHYGIPDVFRSLEAATNRALLAKGV